MLLLLPGHDDRVEISLNLFQRTQERNWFYLKWSSAKATPFR